MFKALVDLARITKYRNVGFYSCSPFRSELRCDLESCGCRVSSFLWTSEKVKIGYVEIPKAGSTSVKSALELRVETEHAILQAAVLAAKRRSTSWGLTDRAFGPTVRGATIASAYFRQNLTTSSPARIKPSPPSGTFDFSHRFDVETLPFSDYRWFTVVRDPMDRLASALTMFFSAEATDFRRKQREKISSLLSNDIVSLAGIRELVRDVEKNRNHHFEAQKSFVPEQLVGRVELISLRNLDSFLSAEFGLKGAPILNRSVARESTDTKKKEFVDKLRVAIQGTTLAEDVELDLSFLAGKI